MYTIPSLKISLTLVSSLTVVLHMFLTQLFFSIAFDISIFSCTKFINENILYIPAKFALHTIFISLQINVVRVTNPSMYSSLNRYLYNFLSSGEFDDMGMAEGNVEEGLGVVKSLRLNVHEESDNWAILSEVSNFQELWIYVLFCHGIFRENMEGLVL